MTDSDVIQHWRNGAQNELQSAQLLFNGSQYSATLFHCHLAVEKALKAMFMQQLQKDAPMTHDLLQIALQLTRVWTDDEKKVLADLTEYAVAARYDDPMWAEHEANKENTSRWLERVTQLLSTLLS